MPDEEKSAKSITSSWRFLAAAGVSVAYADALAARVVRDAAVGRADRHPGGVPGRCRAVAWGRARALKLAAPVLWYNEVIYYNWHTNLPQ